MSASKPETVVDRLAVALSVTGGRRGGDPETRIHLDHLMPELDPTRQPSARWRLRTANRRLTPAPAGRAAMAAWHAADGSKGRRLLAQDLRADRVAALLSWHFEASAGPIRRPHLVTSAAAIAGVAGPSYAESRDALWLLLCTILAIDALTLNCGEVGMAVDAAIELDADDVHDFGFVRGRRRGGYEGDYWVLRRPER